MRVRIVTISFLLGIELSVQQYARFQNLTVVQVPMKFFLAVLVIWCVLDLIYYVLLKISTDYVTQSYMQVVLDLILVSLVVYFTGGLDSYFYLLYPLTVWVASVILPRGGAYLMACVSFIYAGIVLELPYFDLVPFYGLVRPDLKELQLKIAANLVAFLAVAHLGSKLAETLRQTGVELKDLQALNQDIIESLRSGLITTDLNGHILLSNSAAGEILGLPAGSLRHRPIQSLFPQAALQPFGGLSSVRREVVWSDDNEQKKYLGLTVSPLTRNAQTVGYVYNFQDVTQMKQLEREIQLQDRMAAIGRMAAAIAHEIRNPLASIAGSVKLFSGMVGGEAQEQRLIKIVMKESERLNTIINDFLQYSREMKFEFAVVNLSEILEETLTLLRNHPKFDRRYRVIKEVPSTPVLASVDANRIRQVFWNLGDNALKAMPQGGTLSVQVKPQKDHVELLFRDTGAGLTPRQAEKLFEPFQSDFEGGTGLGLAIVYQIVQAHKGSIQAESTRQGCVFRIELPLAAPLQPKDQQPIKVPRVAQP